MLMRFNVGNFLSFDSTQEFSMFGGKVKQKQEHIYNDTKVKLLKFAGIYGANASGKSNLVKAIDFAKETVVNGLPKKHITKYYKNNSYNKNKSSYFEFEIMIEGKYYSYGFEVILNSSSIVSEWLIELNPKNDKEIFTRDITKGTYKVDSYFKSAELKLKLDLYANDIKEDDNVLFLSIMNKNKNSFYIENVEAKILEDVFKWIHYKLDINYPNRPVTDYYNFITNENIDDITNMINGFGTGITKFNIVDVTQEQMANVLPKELLADIINSLENKVSENKKIDSKSKDKARTNMMIRTAKEFFIIQMGKDDNVEFKTIQFNHGDKDIFFDLSEESDGTVRILDLLEILLNKKEDKVYIIDEIDRSLHPQLTYKFIETYLKVAAKRNVQLIVTTHESRLLDFELLRRDEIWFINKNRKGESNIYSLDEYNERFDKKIDKAYLEGRYGGIPIFNTIFPIGEE